MRINSLPCTPTASTALLVASVVFQFTTSNRALPAAPGQQACATAAHRHFDFWVGDWEVFDARGQRAGTSRIEKILDGCTLYESWTSVGPARGHSFSGWDSGDRRWHQTWVDNAGTMLVISGGIVNGEMVMEGERRLPDGTPTTERITWTPNADGSIRQRWESSRDRGMRWTTVFDGVYRRRPG